MLTLKVKDKNYSLRLKAKAVKELEIDEGKSIVRVFGDLEETSLIDPITKLLYYSLKATQPNITLDEVYEIYDDLVEYEGYTVEDITKLIEDILATAGLAQKNEKATPKK